MPSTRTFLLFAFIVGMIVALVALVPLCLSAQDAATGAIRGTLVDASGGLALGVRWDLQTFTTAGLISDPLFPISGKVPFQPYTLLRGLDLRIRLATTRPPVVRAGYGIFYVRIPQIPTSVIRTGNGVTDSQVFLNNTEYYDHQVFPTYPNPRVGVPALCGELCAACGIHPGSDEQRFSLRFQLRDSASAAGQPQVRKGSGGPHHVVSLPAQPSRRTFNTGAGREPAAA